jgi:hypothetical protein
MCRSKVILPKGYNNRNRLAQELLALVLRKLLIFPQYRVDARQHSRRLLKD